MSQTNLPIHAVIGSLIHTLSERHEAVLEAPPGAGKTTVVPLEILHSGILKQQKIYLLQPRRMAARACAERMAKLLNEGCGQRVGYQVRQESKVSASTRIVVMTEGVLLRHLQDDPSLEGVGMVIFDEFHERNLDSDFGMALCLQARSIFRSEEALKLLVMSATLNGNDIASYLNQAPIVRSEGKIYPLDIRYAPDNKYTRDPTRHLLDIVQSALPETQGDILIFLPGKNEIDRLIRLAEAQLPEGVSMLPLHGSLSFEQQRLTIGSNEIDTAQPRQMPQRRIIVATDIAETSLTIEGVHTVIDSGLARVPRYHPGSGITRLETQYISLASANQRAGRAARLGPGRCYRLWNETTQAGLKDFATPQIQDADLAPLALQMMGWGLSSPDELAWLSPPPTGNFSQALALLRNLGAIEERTPNRHQLTAHGKAMLALPTHPRLAHMLIDAAEKAWQQQACQIAALLSERDTLSQFGVDFFSRIELLQKTRSCPGNQQAWLQRVRRQSDIFGKLIHAIGSAPSRQDSETDIETRTALCLCAAFPDRIAKQTHADGSYKLSNGRKAHLPPGDNLANAEWLIVVDLGGADQRGSDRIFSAMTLDKNLFARELAPLLQQEKYCQWSEEHGRFVAEHRTWLGKILFSTEKIHNISQQEIHQGIIKFIRAKGIKVLPWTEECKQWQARLALVKNLCPEMDWPDLSNEALLETLEVWLTPYLQDISSINALQKIPLLNVLGNLVNWSQQQELNKLAPETLQVPSGANKKIDYLQDPPVLAVKLQEMFGCQRHPSIVQGRVGVVIHLLSPAQRPLQITQDIAGFWQGSYHEVKKEMRGRYPKHPWPDDPMQAKATAFTKRKSGLE